MFRDGESGWEVVMAVLATLADRAVLDAQEEEFNVAGDRAARERG